MTSGSWANKSTGFITVFIDLLIRESSFILVCFVSRYLFHWNSCGLSFRAQQIDSILLQYTFYVLMF